ncbi:type IA DNA topoisomerase [Comamonas testosteroni]|jgi:DNA topoisomerase-1|uniref:type IA DNA topoisomerase n=1 Tax=Comamonas testosteroni TaxID=285 RepID=UPI0026F152EC|nr:type IA DNA topoisomerase [Comamonas testosteroni]
MNKALLIVESPNKTEKIEAMFPGRFKAMATYGHVCDLPRSPKEGIGIDRETIQGDYALTTDSTRGIDGKRAVAKLVKFLKDNPGTQVYLGTDGDREGESIAAFVMKYLKLKQPQRMRFNAITKEKIEAAYQAAGPIDWNAVSSREARRLIDRIIGYVASPTLARTMKQKGVSAGRVQTAVEALIIERERKIRNHNPQTYYTLLAEMSGWQAQWQYQPIAPPRKGPKPNSEFDIDDTAARCMDADLVKQLSALRSLVVVSCEDKNEERLPPSPFYSFSLVQAANRVFGWDVEKTMETAQKLFEGKEAGHGHITYHRTDSPNIDPIAAEAIREVLRAKGMAVPAVINSWPIKNKNAQEGHEGIIPAYIEIEEAGATDDERALYRLIRERALFSQLAPAQIAVRRIALTDPLGHNKFTASARVVVDPGWLASPAAKNPVMQDDDEDDKEESVRVPKLAPGSSVNVAQMKIQTHSTKAPPRYTIRSLTAKLETLGIGRPATLSSIFKGMLKKGTVNKRKDGKFEATPLGEQCYDILYPRFGFAHIGYTAELESALDQIAKGDLDGQRLVRHVWDRLDAECAGLATA